jgi:ribosomal protein S27AE
MKKLSLTNERCHVCGKSALFDEHRPPEFDHRLMCAPCFYAAARKPQGPQVPELVRPGDVISLHHYTERFTVRRIEPFWIACHQVTAYSIVLSPIPKPRIEDDNYPRFRDLIGVNGRIVSANLCCLDEVVVHSTIHQPGQLALFGEVSA